MLVKPPMELQPQQIDEKAPINNVLEAKSIENEKNNGETSVVTAPSIIGQPVTEDKEIVIRKKAQYKAFMKLIKENKYTTAILTARVLGVNKNTITDWLNTPKVKEAMRITYHRYISDIEASKDWNSKKYLIDKLEDKDKEKVQVDIQNLILVKR